MYVDFCADCGRGKKVEELSWNYMRRLDRLGLMILQIHAYTHVFVCVYFIYAFAQKYALIYVFFVSTFTYVRLLCICLNSSMIDMCFRLTFIDFVFNVYAYIFISIHTLSKWLSISVLHNLIH